MSPLQKAVHMRMHIMTYPNESVALILIGMLFGALLVALLNVVVALVF